MPWVQFSVWTILIVAKKQGRDCLPEDFHIIQGMATNILFLPSMLYIDYFWKNLAYATNDLFVLRTLCLLLQVWNIFYTITCVIFFLSN